MKLDELTETKFINALKTGVTYEQACAHIGITSRTFRKWMKKGLRGESDRYVNFYRNVRSSIGKPIEEAKKKREKFVYLIEESWQGCVKIGVAGDIKARLKELQIACPQDLRVIGFIPTENAHRTEGDLHARFEKSHIRGEWYALSPDQIDSILNNYGGYRVD